jgi:type VI protein secretion system component VasK
MKAGFSSLNVEEVDSMMSNLDDISAYMVMLGVPMAALAFLKGFYPKGSVSRSIPAVIMVLITLYWIWVIGLGGKFVFDSIEEISLELDFSKLLLLLMVGTALWIVYYVLELLLYRPDWKDAGFPKDLPEERKARKEAQRKAKEERKAAKEKMKEEKRAAKEKMKETAEQQPEAKKEE